MNDNHKFRAFHHEAQPLTEPIHNELKQFISPVFTSDKKKREMHPFLSKWGPKQVEQVSELHDFDKRLFHKIKGAKPDFVKSIDDPEFRKPKWEDFDRMGVGVSFNGEYHFYPLDIISNHEIVNDHFGQVHVSVTYSPTTFTAVAFKDRRFGVSGYLYNQNLVMYDRLTGHLVNQMLRLNLGNGTSLDHMLVTCIITSLRDWVGEYPNTVVLNNGTRYYDNVKIKLNRNFPNRPSSLAQKYRNKPAYLIIPKNQSKAHITIYNDFKKAPQEIYDIWKKRKNSPANILADLTVPYISRDISESAYPIIIQGYAYYLFSFFFQKRA